MNSINMYYVNSFFHLLFFYIGWHVYGLMHRADKNYAEASKLYTQALKYNKNDVNILRDFALMQTQLRQYDSAAVSHTYIFYVYT
jgi:peptide alpha-N-acetyltransferase